MGMGVMWPHLKLLWSLTNWFILGLPECQKCLLVGIVVQRLTSAGSSKMQPPQLVHQPNKPPVPEILQVLISAACCTVSVD